MNAKSIFKSIVISSLLINLIQPATAQAMNDVNVGAPTDYMSDSLAAPVGTLQQDGTADQQGKLLIQINNALASGSLSAAEASDLKGRLNQVNQSESWYVSSDEAIPANVLERDKQALNALANELQGKPQQAIVKDDSIKTDIDSLIGKALAHNRITSQQAEQYYLELGQIESDLSNAQKNPTQLGSQLAAMNKSLSSLRSELVHKVY